MKTPLTVTIAIVSCGRPAILRETIDELRNQSYPVQRIVVCTPRPSDAAGLVEAHDLVLLQGPMGAPHQRNVVLSHAQDTDLIVFFDDDFIPDRDYLFQCVQAFQADPTISAATGRVLADGAKGPGISSEAALAMLADPTVNDNPNLPPVETVWSSYGCNMAFRMSEIRRHGVRFDERLPLYAWYEDIDFSRRLGRHGRIVKVNSAKGIHMGTKTGRTPGRRLGYSQVANPVYLSRKGTFPWDHTLRSVGRNIAMNLIFSLRPEPYVDRRGRLIGNGLALVDMLRGRIAPERILTL
ncbi:glycosyltransferase family 2 protein [Gluconacetobacter azotocaptans]|uniref:Glycosyltransferase family 2 protein n=1 Tax=Gluconacetobacter azotocaptans TaxID=142834 RepID=A0A7W4JPK2_9PROT|nr:glycosyltransferase [Gluconacetobacter azotocaptans]MBB2188591.1 glycosyltransferase family 2 protein [Gluconacetobacter azotocaptans]MBM9400296.1 glycosyltransferase family 2 protein [Gluconacetobacter azotocaptans]